MEPWQAERRRNVHFFAPKLRGQPLSRPDNRDIARPDWHREHWSAISFAETIKNCLAGNRAVLRAMLPVGVRLPKTNGLSFQSGGLH